VLFVVSVVALELLFLLFVFVGVGGWVGGVLKIVFVVISVGWGGCAPLPCFFLCFGCILFFLFFFFFFFFFFFLLSMGRSPGACGETGFFLGIVLVTAFVSTTF
jgi:hypothetical protein